MSCGLVAFPVADLWQVEPLVRASTFEVSHTPAEWLKPEKTSPPRVRAKLAPIILRSKGFPWLSCV
jgi:hypothetical protein